MRSCLVIFISLFSYAAMAQVPADSVAPVHIQDSLAAKAKKKFPWQWVVPGTLVGLGVWGTFDNNIINRNEVKEERYEHFSTFHKHIDDLLPYVPGAAVYLLHATGVKPKHDVVNYSVILLKSELVMVAVTTVLKNSTHILRPDSSAFNSFPSGHTAQAFLAANFLRHELGHRSIWYSIAGYAIASGVGMMRIANNRHWVGDVLAGAGIGILSSELAYATHRYKWNKKHQVSVLPAFGRSFTGIYAVMKL